MGIFAFLGIVAAIVIMFVVLWLLWCFFPRTSFVASFFTVLVFVFPRPGYWAVLAIFITIYFIYISIKSDIKNMAITRTNKGTIESFIIQPRK